MKNILIFFIILFSISCTKIIYECTEEIYRGQVAHIDSEERKLITLYGTNQSIWSEERDILLNDIVEVSTVDKLQNVNVNVLCSPKLDHCHFVYPLHVRGHIKEIPLIGKPLEYGGQNYVTGEFVEFTTNDSASDTIKVWVEQNYDFTIDSVHVILLENEFKAHQTVKGRKLVVHYTTIDHPGHK